MSKCFSRARFRGMDRDRDQGRVAERAKEGTRGANNDIVSRSRLTRAIIVNGKRITPSRSNPAITDPKLTTLDH